MKKFTFLLFIVYCLFLNNYRSLAQSGVIITVAGNGTNGFSGDGGPAILAKISYPQGVATDTSGNLYIIDAGNYRIRKVTRSGIITTFAGNGVSGITGDGGPATAAAIGEDPDLYGIATDHAGNVFFSDWGSIRKISTTGIINTIAGDGIYTNTGDGGPATAAGVTAIAVAVDASGNIYFCTGSAIRMINTSGIVNTIAGTGISGFSGDGGPALAAQFNAPKGIALDRAGNLYVADSGNGRIRMINTSTGIINTIAGNGAGGSTGDCGPAISASLNGPGGVFVDTANNVFILERDKVRMVKANNGLIRTIAANGTSGYSGDNGPAPLAEIANYTGPGITVSNGLLYILDNGNNRIRVVSLNGAWLGNILYVNVNKSCSGGSFSFYTLPYTPSQVIKTYYGDGSVDSTTVTSGSGYGTAFATHIYSASGTYNIRHILYQGGVSVDSISYSYEYSLCNVLPIKNYYDELGTCSYVPASDSFFTHPLTIEVDSNGVSIDTISATSGFYYSAYGSPNDVYSFRLLPVPLLPVVCPSSGIITDTIRQGIDSADIKYFGVSCGTSANFDLAVNAVVPVTGVDDEWGNIYISNHGCSPTTAIVTLHYSPKYNVDFGGYLDVYPAATSYTSNSITWNLSALSAVTTTPVDLYYAIWSAGGCCGVLSPGDTIQSYYTVTPIIGDSDTLNNIEIVIDTVKAGCDPNEMWVSPQGNIPSDTQLQYTINFDNTGNDTAFNIYVMDTISDNLNISSFRITSASNVMNVTKLYDNIYHNIIRFDFPNINLLDSSHHGQCTGYVSFNINTINGLAQGSTVFNWAGIFFDYNPVVMTNVVEDIVGAQYPEKTPVIKGSSNTSATVSIFPNPTTSQLTIIMSPFAYSSFTITNNLGQNMIQQPLSATQTQVNVTPLPPGMYYVTFRGDNGTTVQKFVKM